MDSAFWDFYGNIVLCRVRFEGCFERCTPAGRFLITVVLGELVEPPHGLASARAWKVLQR